jgi:hypothetical protein
MKSFKKIVAGVCSLMVLSAVATCAVSATDETTGASGNIGYEDGDTTSSVSTPVDGTDNSGDTTQAPTIGDEDGDTTTSSSEVAGDTTQAPTIGDEDGDTTTSSSEVAGDTTQAPTIGDEDGDTTTTTETVIDLGESKETGDANGDGEIDAVDLLITKKYVLQMIDVINPAADITGDGEVDSVDLLWLKKYLLQLIDSFDEIA